MTKFVSSILTIPDFVLFPNASLALDISDPHFLRLIRDAFASGIPVSLSRAIPMGKTPLGHPIFSPSLTLTMGKIFLLEEKKASVRILIKGQKRVKLLSTLQEIPYLIGEVEEYEDRREQVQTNDMIEKLKNLFYDWVKSSLRQNEEREAFLKTPHNLHEISDYLSTFLVSDSQIRQVLLECDSLFERLKMLDMLLIKKEGHLAIKSYEVIDKITKLAN